MELNFYTLCVLYLVYSFLGWVAETVVATIKGRAFVNRGVASGPFCFVYGTAAVLMAVGFADLRSTPVALFLGCAANATVVEWVTAKLLERMHRRRWWDYSDKKFNLDGYVCLQYSVLWGLLGMASVLWGNVLLLRLCALLPGWLLHIGVWAAMTLAVLDQLGAALAVNRYAASHPRLEQLNLELEKHSDKLRQRLIAHVEKRIQRAYPTIVQPEPTAQKEKALSFGDLVWLFVIGAFLGDVVETLFCRVTAGIWMSRSSLVWGPFSVVWGLALVMAAVLLRGSEERSDRSIFLFGFVMGGAYEYICSAVGELLFGVIFWDYSGFKFNLGGRVNLLYCFFWGIAAVVWFKILFPPVEKWIEKIPAVAGKILTWVLLGFMVCNILVSCVALVRYDERGNGVQATNAVQKWADAHYDDAKMKKIYPNAKGIN